MNLTVSKKDLLKLLSRMQGVAEKKSTMPVLANVLLVARDGVLELSATDLYQSLRGSIPADVAKPGTLAVSAHDACERAKQMPDGPIVISSQESDGKLRGAVMKAQGSARKYTLRAMDGDDFPPLPRPADGAPTLTLSVGVLAELIAKTHFSISTDETRAHLNSALFEWDGDVVRMVSTDGHRLSKVDIAMPGHSATATMLIPLKAILELRRMCDEIAADAAKDETPSLLITQSGASAFFEAGGTTFSVKLVDAQFPPYSQVIPQTNEKTARAPRSALANALKAVSVAASERTGGVKMSFSTGKLSLSSESPETGDGQDELPVDYSGPNMSIGFNAKYFLDVLAAITDDEVAIGLSGDLDPAVLRPAGATTKDERQFLAVVMPMRV